MPVSRRTLLGAAALGFLTGPLNRHWATARAQTAAAPQLPPLVVPTEPDDPNQIVRDPPLLHPAKGDPEALIPRIWNRTDEPFTFQFRRRRGVPWGEPTTIPARQYLRLDETIAGYQDYEFLHEARGAAVIQYRDYGGRMTAYLKLQTHNPKIQRIYERFFAGELAADERRFLIVALPYVFVLRDHEGHYHLVTAFPTQVAETQPVLPITDPPRFKTVAEFPPDRIYEYAIAKINEISRVLHGTDLTARQSYLEQLVGRGNIELANRIRVLESNHMLVRDRIEASSARVVRPLADGGTP